MPTPDQNMFKVFDRTLQAWNVLNGIRSVAARGLDAHVNAAKEQIRAFLDSPDIGQYVFDLPKVKRPEVRAGILDAAGVQAKAIPTWGVDAVSIVYAHSIVDLSAMGYLRIIADVAPADWAPALEDKRVTFKDLAAHGEKELSRRALVFHLANLERESLVTKADRLHALCKPDEKYVPPVGYKFDLERLENFDTLRHRIVHEDGLFHALPKLDDELWFLNQTTVHFMALVNFRYGIRLDLAP